MDKDKDVYWLPIPGEDFLEGSSHGNIRRLDRLLAVSDRDARGRSIGNFKKVVAGGPEKPWLQKNGYLMISRMIYGVTRKNTVHRLIAMTFVPGYFDGATVDHIDGNRLNNRADNLQWVTRSENTRLQNVAGRGVPTGENHPFAKLRDMDVPELFNMRNQGLSCEKIGKHFGVSGSLVHKITTGLRRTS